MSAIAGTTAKPLWAVTAWVDDNAVYVELPTLTGPYYISKFPLTESGLSKALNLMRTIHRQAQPRGGSYRFTQPNITRATPNFSEDQRQKARDVLKRLKIT